MRPRSCRSAASLVCLLLALAFAAVARAQAPVGTAVGMVTHLSGTLLVKRAGATRALSVKSEIQEGDTLMTQADTYARFKFNDNGELVMRPESQLDVTRYSYKAAEPQQDGVLLGLVKGGMRSVTGLLGQRSKDKFSVQTNTATIGIRGTHFGALFCQADCGGIQTPAGGPPPDGLHVDVAQGAITLTNPAGTQVVNAGQFGYVRDNATPPIIQPPAQGIQVTMPPSISRNDTGGRPAGAKSAEPECVVQ
jgi:hypothetical protein